MKQKRHLFDLLWDLWCIGSVVGIWPRFIEPNMLNTTKLNLKIPNLPKELDQLKILQFSDLHLHPRVPDRFLQKIQKKVKDLNPDLIVFTGDFLCYAKMKEKERLKNFLNGFNAPFGCYAIVGNHDYEECISINPNGVYDIVDTDSSEIGKGFQRLFKATKLQKMTAERAQSLKIHGEIPGLLKQTPFQLLNNECELIPIKGSYLNLCGLGEYMLGHHDLDKTFEKFDKRYPGIILAHNPDTAPHLAGYPGQVVLSGHTHGGQVNLPWMWKKFTLLENMQFKKGLHQVNNKWLYVSRGVGSTVQFRWFSPPEIVEITLEAENGN